MKKIISACSLVLALAVVITVFAACGKKTEDESTTTTTESTSTFVANEPKLNIYEDYAMASYGDGRIQRLNFPEGFEKEFDYEYAKEHYDFVDMNFDGVLDISIAVKADGNVISYYCWLYSSIINGYEFSEELSALKNISIDAEKKQILSVDYSSGKEVVKIYVWLEGKLTEHKTYGSKGETIPSDVNDTVKHNSIGSNKKPAADGSSNTTKEPTPTQNSGSNTNSTTKPDSSSSSTNTNKPQNTTKPSNQGGGIEIAPFDEEGWF